MYTHTHSYTHVPDTNTITTQRVRMTSVPSTLSQNKKTPSVPAVSCTSWCIVQAFRDGRTSVLVLHPSSSAFTYSPPWTSDHQFPQHQCTAKLTGQLGGGAKRSFLFLGIYGVLTCSVEDEGSQANISAGFIHSDQLSSI